MEDAAFADMAALVDFYTRIENRSLADGDARADIDLRIDLAAVADNGPRFHDCEIAYIAIRSDFRIRRYGGPFADACATGFRCVVHLQEFHYAGTRISTLMSVAATGCDGSNVLSTSTMLASVL